MKLGEQAVAALYQDHGHLVLRRCQLLLRDAALAEDALHEVFVRLLRYGGGVQEARSTIAWLYRVADRVCFDLLRRRARVADAASQPLELAPPQAAPSVDPAQRDLAVRLLAHIDERARQIVVLHFVDGLSQSEVAQEVGLTRQTVNQKLQQLRARMQRLAARAEAN